LILISFYQPITRIEKPSAIKPQNFSPPLKTFFMIPVAIIWLVRRYMKKRNLKFRFPKWNTGNRFPLLVVFLVSCLVILSFTSPAQYRSVNYSITRNGSKIGSLRFCQFTRGDKDYIKIESEVKVRFILSFTVKASEDALYSGGVMVKSSIFRQTNGSVKANKQHEAVNNQYVIHDGSREGVFKNYPITFNMLRLYAGEPVNVDQVYSDNYETFITLEKTEPHSYKISLPNGNYNVYHYENGILKMAEVHTDLYTAKIEPTNS
jgi:uncharacterized protein DUF6134